MDNLEIIRQEYMEQMRSDIMKTIQDPDDIQYTYEEHRDHKGWNIMNGFEKTWARGFEYAKNLKK